MENNSSTNISRRGSFLLFTLLTLLIPLVLSYLSAQSAQALAFDAQMQQTSTESSASTSGPLCRYGIAASEAEGHVVAMVGAGWFLKFNSPVWYGPLPAGGAEQVHVIKTFQLKDDNGRYLPEYTTSVPLDDELASYISSHPGGLWIIGNEVDRGPDTGQIEGGQGDMYPEMYAVAYHEIHGFIKANDATARVANSALVEVTPGRMQYLDRVWDAYEQKYGHPMQVDIWNMHLYALPEVTPDGLQPNSIANIALGTDISLGKRGSGGNPQLCAQGDVTCKAEHDDMGVFAEQVRLMRQWMKDHGQQQKPLILSEFSILYGYAGSSHPYSVADEYGEKFSPERVSSFMTNAFDYLNETQDAELGYGVDNDRLVQQWLWFAAYSWWGSSSDLVEPDLQKLTLMGQTFRDYVAADKSTIDLVVDEIPRSVATISADGTAAAVLRVPIRNAGNSTLTKPFRVSFYADAARTKLIDSIIITPNLKGCATATIDAQGIWKGLAAGVHPYWVHIDSDDDIAEQYSGSSGNIGKGYVLVNTHGIRLPVIVH